MRDLVFSIALGAASGILGVLAYRFRLAWLGWIALAPLGTALYLYSPVDAGVAGVVCGALIVGPDRQLSRPAHPGARREEVLLAASLTLLWALVAAFGAWLWPHGIPAWGR
jgi:hypothetical protein